MLPTCATALVLLLDASYSVGTAEWRQQVEGHAEALASPSVTSIIERGPVAVTALAFASGTATLMRWRVLRTSGDALAFAAGLAGAERPFWGSTATGDAVRAGLAALEEAPCAAEALVLDVVSDGESNEGVAPEVAREEAEAAGVRINALGVRTQGRDDPAGWLRQHVVTPGGFAIEVEGWDAFAAAIRRKLALEVAAR